MAEQQAALFVDRLTKVYADGTHADLLAARRAGMLSVGLLSGGYGEDELARAGSFRVSRDPEELRVALDELGVLSDEL